MVFWLWKAFPTPVHPPPVKFLFLLVLVFPNLSFQEGIGLVVFAYLFIRGGHSLSKGSATLGSRCGLIWLPFERRLVGVGPWEGTLDIAGNTIYFMYLIKIFVCVLQQESVFLYSLLQSLAENRNSYRRWMLMKALWEQRIEKRLLLSFWLQWIFLREGFFFFSGLGSPSSRPETRMLLQIVYLEDNRKQW